MQSTLTQSFVVVGRVARPFGINGWNHLTSFTDPPDNLFQYRPWALRSDSDHPTDWHVVTDFDIQLQGDGMLVCFENSNSRDDARKFTNTLIGVPREVLPPLKNNEHYWIDLLGVEVVNLTDEKLGIVHDVSWNGAHPVLLVRGTSDMELMIPLVPEYVLEIDSGAKIRVDWIREWA